MGAFGGASVYQVYIKSFSDGHGSGIGDILGIIHKLDYLKFLGITHLWITPFYVSPEIDNGYDVTDYTSINPKYGTMEDFDLLIQEARKRGIGVILDMVFNHTSTQHPWFQKALSGDTYYQQYYFFRKGKQPGVPPTNWSSKFGGSAWKYVPALDKWYLHLFSEGQADLNWDNQDVRKAIQSVLSFWEQKQVAGFRFDVINLVSKPELFTDDQNGDGRSCYTDGPHIHEYIRELVETCGLKNYLTVGEMSSTHLKDCISYASLTGNELSMVFSFQHLKVDYADGDKWRIQKFQPSELFSIIDMWQRGMQEGNAWNTLFWSNHDQPRVVSRFGDEGEYWKQSAKSLAAMMYLLRGTPFIYQGEELGMTNAHFSTLSSYRDIESIKAYDILTSQGNTAKNALEVLSQRSRDNSRTPMQWDSTPYAGFSTGNPWIAINPNHAWINAEGEKKDPDSILWWYKRLLLLRAQSATIQYGTYKRLDPTNPSVFLYQRIGKEDTFTIICNCTKNYATFQLPSPLKGNVILANYLNPQKTGLLRPYECLVVREKKGAHHATLS